MSILDDAKTLVAAKRNAEENERRWRAIALEEKYKDAIFTALETLGAPSPRLNYSDKLIRVTADWPCFEVVFGDLIVRNGSAHYVSVIELQETSVARRTIQVNTAAGTTHEERRQAWTKRIAETWYEDDQATELEEPKA